MGQLDQFAKEMFAAETEEVTGGAAAWISPMELSLAEVRLDGGIAVREPDKLLDLPAPWSLAHGHDEIVVELKMPGDHLDMTAVQRALLRRQARQVQRNEDPDAPWDGEEALWVVAPHVPAILRERRAVHEVARGCHRIETGSFAFLWIAANELPLVEALIPFLVARSGRPLDELCGWLKERRPPEWLARVVEFLPMSAAVYDELLRFVVTKTEDPEINARKRRMVRVLVDTTPEVREELVDQGRLAEARSALRRVLTKRKLAPGADEQARIDACADLGTLERWHDQAVTAPTLAEALQ